MWVRRRGAVALATALVFGVLGAGSAAAQEPAGGPITKDLLMAFHACDNSAGQCGNPQNHRVYLAESNDGASWSVVPGWQSYSASVPDVIRRGDTVYLFTPGGIARYRMDSGEWDTASLELDDPEAPAGYVDPSLTIDEEGRLVLFGLQGVLGQDPARCAAGEASCVKRFRSATEVPGSDGTRFEADSGDRVSVTISGSQSASDPDVFFTGSGYVLYVSSGNSIAAFSSSDLRGSYTPIAGLPNGMLSNGTGGIGSGLVPTPGGSISTYAHVNQGGANVIRRAVHADFSRALNESDWTTVLTGPAVGLSSTTGVESPGIAENDPGDDTEPDTDLTRKPKKTVTAKGRKAKVMFKFESEDEFATFECKRDKKPYEECDSPEKYSANPGRHKFKVRAIDLAGNVDASPAKRSFKVKK